MNQLQMLKMALISYVNSAKAIWSAVAHPLTIIGSKKCNLKDYKIYAGGKNLLDVQKYYGDYANDNGGISVPNSGILYYLTYDCEKVTGVFKEKTQYTFSCKYNIADTTATVLTPQIHYTDGTRSNLYLGYGYRMGEGAASLTSNKGKTVASFGFTYGTTSKVFNGELTEMQIEEGATATEYEPYQYTDNFPITIRGKNYFDLDKVPFSDLTTQPYNNGIKATKTSRDNRGNKIPISLPLNKEIKMTMEVVDSKIEGTTERITMGFFNKSGTRVRSTLVTSTKEKKTYIFTLSEEVSYVQFYLQADNAQNVVGDYVTMDNIMLRTEGDDTYEHYITPQTIDIFLDEPLGAGKVIQKSMDNLPNLPQYKGTTIYEVQADTPPSGIEVCYYG